MSNFVEADHYSKIAPGGWRWPNFSPAEIACRGTGRIKISRELMDRLQRLRESVGAPLIINSAYRSPEHNRAVGGARNSQHVLGLAVDVSMANHDPEVFVAAAKAAGFRGIGWYPPKGGNFVHVDLGSARTWGTPWKATRFDPEARPAAAKKAVGVATLASLGAGAAEAVKPDTLMEIQKTVEPWIALAPVFQGVFAACGFGLVGWIVYQRFFKAAP